MTGNIPPVGPTDTKKSENTPDNVVRRFADRASDFVTKLFSRKTEIDLSKISEPKNYKEVKATTTKTISIIKDDIIFKLDNIGPKRVPNQVAKDIYTVIEKLDSEKQKEIFLDLVEKYKNVTDKDKLQVLLGIGERIYFPKSFNSLGSREDNGWTLNHKNLDPLRQKIASLK